MANQPDSAISVEVICRTMDQMRSDRTALNQELEECAAMACPEKSGMLNYQYADGNRDTAPKIRKFIIDKISDANSVMQRGLYSNLTPPGTQWFKTPCKKDLPLYDSLKDWFNQSSITLFQLLAASNFNMEICETFEDYGWAGFVDLFTEPDPLTTFKFTNLHPLEFYCQENADHRIDTVYREFRLTARQVYEKFSGPDDHLPEKIVKDATSPEYQRQSTKYSIIHAVYPNLTRQRDADGNPLPDNKNKAFKSVYVCRDPKFVLRESGYDENPHTVGRFEKKSTSIYGYSPCRRIRRTALTANKVWFTILAMGDKLVDPPMLADAAAYRGLTPQLFQHPGAVNLYDGSNLNNRKPIDFLQIPSQLPYGLEIFDRLDAMVDRAYNVNFFQMLQQLYENAKTQHTAYEIMQMINERLSMMIPLIGPIVQELLQPVILKCWRIAFRAGRFGTFPADAKMLPNFDAMLDISFDSPLAQAAKKAVVQGMMDSLNALSVLAPLDGNACYDWIDDDKAAQKILEIYGTSPEVLRTKSQVDTVRQQRQQAQQQQQQQQMALEIAKRQNFTGPVAPSSAAASMLPGLTGGRNRG